MPEAIRIEQEKKSGFMDPLGKMEKNTMIIPVTGAVQIAGGGNTPIWEIQHKRFNTLNRQGGTHA